MARDASRFGRRFILPDLLLLTIEIAVVGAPLAAFFRLGPPELALLRRLVPPVLLVAHIVWSLVVRRWRAPIRAALASAESGSGGDEMRAKAYVAILKLPRRLLALRVGLWTAVCLSVAITLNRRGAFSL